MFERGAGYSPEQSGQDFSNDNLGKTAAFEGVTDASEFLSEDDIVPETEIHHQESHSFVESLDHVEEKVENEFSLASRELMERSNALMSKLDSIKEQFGKGKEFYDMAQRVSSELLALQKGAFSMQQEMMKDPEFMISPEGNIAMYRIQAINTNVLEVNGHVMEISQQKILETGKGIEEVAEAVVATRRNERAVNYMENIMEARKDFTREMQQVEQKKAEMGVFRDKVERMLDDLGYMYDQIQSTGKYSGMFSRTVLKFVGNRMLHGAVKNGEMAKYEDVLAELTTKKYVHDIGTSLLTDDVVDRLLLGKPGRGDLNRLKWTVTALDEEIAAIDDKMADDMLGYKNMVRRRFGEPER